MKINTSIEKLDHQKINIDTDSVLNLGQLLTGLKVRSCGKITYK